MMMENLLVTPANFASQSNRLKTFANSQEDLQLLLPILEFVAAGFIYAGSNKVRCPWCEMELRNFDPTHSPISWHRTYSRTCPFLRNNGLVNDTDLGISFPEPSSSTVVELRQVLPGQRLQTGASNVFNDELDSDHPQMPSDGHLTIQNRSEDFADDDGDDMTPNSDELSRVYQSNKRLRSVLHPSQIEKMRRSGGLSEAPSTANYQYERHRKLTFAQYPKRDTVSLQSLAASGFIYTGFRDEVRCMYCDVRIEGWTSEMIPNKVHHAKAPSCLFIQGSETVNNIPDIVNEVLDGEDFELRPGNDRQISVELGIITDSTAHPDLAVFSRRESTFLTWPRSNKKLASEMIEHSLYYTGVEDTVCCFSCGTEMSKWSAIENIWMRHTRQAPHCQLVLREKGQDYITSIIAEHGRYVEPPKEPAINVVTTRMLRPRMDSPVAQSVLALSGPDYKRDEVRNALINNIKFGGPDFKYLHELVRAILKKQEDKEDLDRVRRAIEETPNPPEIVSAPRPNAPAHEHGEQTDELHADAHPPPDIQMTEGGGAASAEPGTSAGTSRLGASSRQQASPPPPVDDPRELAKMIKSQMTCKICMDALVGITFLPCGHLVCCPACAPAMVHCPLCRQDVKGTVRAHLDKL